MRILLTVQYLGTRYAGWQSQTNALAIQDVIEEALQKIFHAAVRIEGAGRTDSGVHAAAQRAHFDAPFELPLPGLVRGMNDLLPSDIRILDAGPVDDDFHCRFRAKTKIYAYRIWNASVLDVFRSETHAHAPRRLDIETMQRAAAPLAGTHDFRAFTVQAPEVSSTTRTISAITINREEPPWHRPQSTDPEEATDAQLITIRVAADGFLRYMVRRIAGSLIEIGRGKLDADAIARSLEPHFEEARWTAPAKGLVLEEIRY